MTEFSRLKRKKPNRLRVILLVVVLFVVLYLLKNADGLVSQFFGK
ncbi:hypothetical protein FHR24_003053 [Wenyingzhuangia heitensis]|uniref:Uncharacterized protein n=1 Tax=Wenyingzhuangia heitensis TaxID=1487859 RepID=A0ABX0UCK3_9FLAO|nr:hypothetical protein [Wenyingzhuangia heitensis]NIJ46564.1 hypothetical protein [Wenyingzhuangia heitensis]